MTQLPLPSSRRVFLAGAGASLIAATGFGLAEAGPNLAARFAAIEAKVGGHIGVAALDTGSGRRLRYRASERFAMCSTFKFLLVAQVLERVDHGALRLDQRIAYGPADLLAYAPVTTGHVKEGGMALGDLCGAAITVSDNGAANLLLRLVGGPAGLTQRLRRLGDPTTRLDRNEPGLNTNRPGDPRDTSTPDAMVATMQKILLGSVLTPASRERLIGWMKLTSTGLGRLRSGFPPSWIVGDKTGTGDRGAVNDEAIAWPPGRAPILVVAYMSGSTLPVGALNDAHKQIGQLVAQAFG